MHGEKGEDGWWMDRRNANTNDEDWKREGGNTLGMRGQNSRGRDDSVNGDRKERKIG
jgi:hypothetical protein